MPLITSTDFHLELKYWDEFPRSASLRTGHATLRSGTTVSGVILSISKGGDKAHITALTPSEAREMASALLTLADEADRKGY